MAKQLADLMCREETVARLSMLARADVGMLFNEDGEVDIKDLKKAGAIEAFGIRQERRRRGKGQLNPTPDESHGPRGITTELKKEVRMRIRITKDRIRVCPACRYLCLKLEDEFLYEEFEDENLNICSDCNEAFVAAIPDEYFAKLATPVTNPVTRNSSPDSCGPTSQMSLFDAEIISSELTELEPIEISDSTQ